MSLEENLTFEYLPFKVGDFVKLKSETKEFWEEHYKTFGHSIGKVSHVEYHPVQKLYLISVTWIKFSNEYFNESFNYYHEHLEKSNLKAFI